MKNTCGEKKEQVTQFLSAHSDWDIVSTSLRFPKRSLDSIGSSTGFLCSESVVCKYP